MIQTVLPNDQSYRSVENRPFRRWDEQDWKVLFLVAGAALALFLPGLGDFGVIDPSEAYYSETGREMLERNEWITPLLNYEQWYEKPALAYWLIAASYKTLGVSEFAARLPSALLGIALVLFTYAFARRFLRRRAALLSALVLLTSPLYLVVGHLSLTDMPFTVCVSVALFSFLGLITFRSTGLFWLGYISLGLAALAKGPLAFILTGLVLTGFLAASHANVGERLKMLLALRPLPGLIVAAAVALPWYIAVCLATKGAFAQEFFIRQNFGRAAGTADHKFPPWFYIPYLFGGAAPWSIFLIGFPGIPVRYGRMPATRSLRSSILKYTAIWSALVFVVLSLIPSKLPTYILPVWPALAIMLGTTLDTMLRLHRGKPLVWTGAVLTAVGAGGLLVAPALLTHSPELLLSFAAAGAVLVFCMAVYTLGLSRGKPKIAVCALAAGTVIATAALVPLALKAFWTYHQSGFRQILETVRLSSANAALAGPIQSSTFYYLRRHVPLIKNKSDLEAFLNETPGPHWVITIKGRLGDLKASHRQMTVLEHHRSWYLVSLGEKVE